MADSKDHITEEGRKASALKLLPTGTVLVVFRSGVLRHTLPVGVTTAPVCVNQDIKALVPCAELDPRFLAIYLATQERNLLPIITKHSTTVQSINSAQFMSLLIPVAPIDVQQALVDQLEVAREARKRKLDQADALLSGMDAFLFAQLGSTARHTVAEGRNLGFAVRRDQLGERMDPKYLLFSVSKAPRKIQSKRLQTLVVAEPDYGSGERALPRTGDGDIKYIRITDFDDFGLAPNDQLMTAAKVDNDYLLQDEDVLFARSGATAGKTFIYTRDIGPAIFAGYCIRFRFDRTKALPWYVYFYTKTAHYKAWVKSIQRPSGQPNINREEFKSFEIPLPSLDKQSEIVAELFRRRQEARRLRSEATREWEAAKAAFERQLLAGTD